MTSSTTSSYGNSGRDAFAAARLLLQQHRFDMAEQQLRQILATNPQDVEAHWLLVSALSGQEKHAQALEVARDSIALAPDLAPGHYLAATVHHALRQWKEAERAAQQAHELDPGNPDYCGLLAVLEVRASRWKSALEWADRGMRTVADHPLCNNMRAHALQMLGRNEEAQSSLDAALQRTPEDSDTHANQGWQFLRAGDHRQATEHFKEALRIQPGHEYARAGMIESLKARNPIYRPIFAYFVFMSRLSQGAQWAMIIGLYLLFRFGREFLAANPSTQMLVAPFVMAYLLFVLTSWTGPTLFNMTLWFHPLGRHALNRDETFASAFCAASFGLGLLWLALGLATGSTMVLLWAAFFPFLSMPIAATFRVATPWKRRLGYAIILAFALPALVGAVATLMGVSWGMLPFLPLILGLALFSWVGNLLFRE